MKELRHAVEEAQDAKTEAARQLAKAQAELAQAKARLEGEGPNRTDELEEAKRRLQVRPLQKKACSLNILSLLIRAILS